MRTSTDSSNSNRRRSSVSSQRFDDEGNAYNAATTIALFGATGATGHHFLRLAVDAGYQVCALIQAGHAANIKSFLDQPCVTFVTGALTDEYKMQQTVEGADYVVVMLGDTLPTKKEYPAGCLTDFMQQLYPILKKEPTVSVLLYQATSLAADVTGSTPIFSKVLKTFAHRRNHFLRDQDAVVRLVARQHGLLASAATVEKENDTDTNKDDKDEHDQDNDDDDKEPTTADFSFIVTRATVLLKDGPPSKKLAASKSQPGPFPVAHVDLAEFSLNALLTEKLYNTCPYVVADSF